MRGVRQVASEVGLMWFAGMYCFIMKLHLLYWNVGRLNNPHKTTTVKNLLREWRVDVVCLQ